MMTEYIQTLYAYATWAVAMLLTSFGHSPGWLDFLYYLDHRGDNP